MKNNYSILRGLEYNELEKLKIDCQILDLGGSKKSGYQQLIKGKHKIVTANIDKNYDCDLIFDIEKKFPLDSESYDAAVCLNVLEHIFNFQNVFAETQRVLKSGSIFIFSTPFIYQIHGSPDDFFRYTESALVRLLKESGFKEIKVIKLNYGLFSLFFQIVGGAIPTNFLRIAIKNSSIFLDSFLLNISKRYRKLNERVPLGYIVRAVK